MLGGRVSPIVAAPDACCTNYDVFVLILQVWRCEFCDERNVVDITKDEVPADPDVTYMINPAPATTAASCQGDESSMVIFCIDISSSMGGRVSLVYFFVCFC